MVGTSKPSKMGGRDFKILKKSNLLVCFTFRAKSSLKIKERKAGVSTEFLNN